MGERPQPLDVNAEQARERVGLGVTKRRELGCDVLNRAMPLAQLHTGQRRAHSDRSGRGRETIGSQCPRQGLRAGGNVLTRSGELRGIPRFELGNAPAGELAHGVGTGVFGQKAQRRGGHVVVVAVQAGVTGLGQDVCAGRPTTTGATSGGGLTLLDGALFGKQVEVTADRGGRQTQTRAEGGRGERAMLGDRLLDPVPGARAETVRFGVGPVRTLGNALVSD